MLGEVDPREPRPLSEREIQRWAEERGVSGDLKLTYPEANRLVPGAFTNLPAMIPAYQSLLDLISRRPGAYSYAALGKGPFEALRTSVWDFLERRAADRVAALELERSEDLYGRSIPEGAEDDPIHIELIRCLRTQRRRIREVVAPMPLGQSTGALTLEDDFPPTAILTWAERPVLGPVITKLSLSVEEQTEIECNCPEARACEHRLELVDRVLRALLVLDQDELRADILGLARTPKWQRLLDHLETTAEKRPPPEAELYWEISHVMGRWQIEPLLLRSSKKPSRPRPIAIRRLLDERGAGLSLEDLEIARLVSAWVELGRDPDPTLLGVLLRKLAGHPRVLLSGEDRPAAVRLWEANLVAHSDTVGTRFLIALGDHRLEPVEVIDRRRREPLADRFIEIDRLARTIDLVAIDKGMWKTIELLAKASAVIPRSEQREIVRRLPKLHHLGPISIEGDVERRFVPAVQKILLRLSTFGEEGLTVQVLLEPLPGAALVIPGQGPSELVASGVDRSLTFTRRLVRDEPIWAAERLRDLLPVDLGVERNWELVLPRLDEALTFLERVRADPELLVEWEREPRYTISRSATFENLRVAVHSSADWLGLEGEVEVDGDRITVAALLAAARGRRRFVRVQGDRFMAIGRSLEAVAERLDGLVSDSKNGLELRPLAVPLLAEIFEDLPRVETSPRFLALLKEARTARSIDPEVPPALRDVLRPYQRDGFVWMARLATWGVGGVLADDMGLGKTLEALAVLSWRKAGGPALVVAPTSVAHNWVREAERYAPDLRPILYRGPNRAELVSQLGPGDLLIVSYPLLARDIDALCRRPFHSLVLDEAQAIKNAASLRARAVRKIRADWRVALTGTPIENHLGELHALFRAIEPNLLGRWEEFRDRYLHPIHQVGEARRRVSLARLIRPFVLRRTKAEVALELPPRTEIQVDVELSAMERALYEDARLAAIAELDELEGVDLDRGRFNVLAALTRLRQIACHPRLAEPTSTVPSSKLVRAVELLGSLVAEGQRVLVFSQFTRHLDLLAEAIRGAGLTHLRLDGSTPAEQRPELIDHFQAGAAPIFLISLKAGGTGLNLTAAENVVHLDPWWNPAVEDQANDRAHRIGQDKPVTVYRLVTKDTIEEAILGLHGEKRALAEALLEGTGNSGKLDTAELVALIRQSTYASPELDDGLET